VAEFCEPVEQLVASIGAVGKEMAQPWEQAVDGLDDQPSAVAIPDVGGMDHGTDQQAGGVGHDMALPPFDLLAGIVTLRPAALGRLDRLAVDDPADGLASRPAASRACSRSSKLIRSKRPVSRHS